MHLQTMHQRRSSELCKGKKPACTIIQINLQCNDREDEDKEDELEIIEDEEAPQDEEEFEDWEEKEWFSVSADAKCEFVERGTMIAIYSYPKAIKRFYIIHVTGTGITPEDMEDEFKHIRKGEKFITGLYLEFDGEK